MARQSKHCSCFSTSDCAYANAVDLEIVELRFFEKRPFAEIANILDITESNAKVRTYRVLERLKKIILKKM